MGFIVNLFAITSLAYTILDWWFGKKSRFVLLLRYIYEEGVDDSDLPKRVYKTG